MSQPVGSWDAVSRLLMCNKGGVALAEAHGRQECEATHAGAFKFPDDGGRLLAVGSTGRCNTLAKAFRW